MGRAASPGAVRISAYRALAAPGPATYADLRNGQAQAALCSGIPRCREVRANCLQALVNGRESVCAL